VRDEVDMKDVVITIDIMRMYLKLRTIGSMILMQLFFLMIIILIPMLLEILKSIPVVLIIINPGGMDLIIINNMAFQFVV